MSAVESGEESNVRVMIAGATGVLGRALSRQLLADGHDVLGIARSPEKADALRQRGVRAVQPQNVDELVDALDGVQALVHLAAMIPKKFAATGEDWEEAGRARLKATRVLVEGALRAGVERFVCQSVSIIHGDTGADWVDEGKILEPYERLRPVFEMENIVDEAVRDHGLGGVILRLGLCYGSESWHSQQMVAALRAGTLPIAGRGDNYWGLVHLADAARAFVQAVESPPVGDTILVVDDEPVPARAFLTELAERLGVSPPREVSVEAARELYGEDGASLLTASNRCRNARARQVLGWELRYPTYREGLSELVPPH